MMEFIEAFQAALQPDSLFYILLGTLVGIVVGAIPGLTGAMVIALTLPMTYSMASTDALSLLVAMYVGAVSGGLLSATLLKIPGTPASIMTTFDGYPMAQSGRAGRALGLGISASFVGGLISWFFLAGLSPFLARAALSFGAYEYFGMTLLAFVLIVSVSEGSVLKGFLGALLGILTALPGLDPVSGQLRLTWGVPELASGFDLLAVLIGVFAISQILLDLSSARSVMTVGKLERFKGLLLRPRDYARHAGNLVRSSVIGTWIGILPGIGGNIGSIVAYSAAKNFSNEPERFGTGSEEGIIASEAANNATVAGAIIPLITLGIPGSVVDAILIGAFFIHNLQPGPLLFTSNPEIAYGIIHTVFIANAAMFIMMLLGARVFIRLAGTPSGILSPTILVFCFVGTFAVHNQIDGVWVMLAFGVVGFFLSRCQIPLGPFVIGLVLAPITERYLRSALMHSGGEFTPFMTRPISAVILSVALASLAYAIWREVRMARIQRDAG